MSQAGVEQALWALGRGAGVTALVLMTISVITGILTRSGRPLVALPRFGVTELHRTTALLGTGLVVLHIITLLADPYAQLRLVDFVVPFLGSYRPVWLGLGTLAVDLLLVILATSLLRHRLGLRAFRVVHWITYGLWPIALARPRQRNRRRASVVSDPRRNVHGHGAHRTGLAVEPQLRRV